MAASWVHNQRTAGVRRAWLLAAGAVVAGVSLLSCSDGDGGETVRAESQVDNPSTTEPSDSSTTTGASGASISVDEDRVTAVLPPEFYSLTEFVTTGIRGERVAQYRYGAPPTDGTDQGRTILVAVHRGTGVTDSLHREPMRQSSADAGPDKQVFENQLEEPFLWRQLAWEVSDEVVLWVASESLNFEELAAIMRTAEVGL